MSRSVPKGRKPNVHGKNTPMRIDEATKRAVNILAGQMQQATGKTITFNDALWALLNEHRPDLAEKALELIRAEESQ